MPLPSLSHCQFAVLAAFAGGSALSGRMIRAALKHLGVQQSGPAFYQLMARLEDADYVDGWYEQEIVAGQIIRQRHYRITRSGSTARAEIRHFYARAARSLVHG